MEDEVTDYGGGGCMIKSYGTALAFRRTLAYILLRRENRVLSRRVRLSNILKGSVLHLGRGTSGAKMEGGRSGGSCENPDEGQ